MGLSHLANLFMLVFSDFLVEKHFLYKRNNRKIQRNGD
jgi:hypothetical protein